LKRLLILFAISSVLARPGFSQATVDSDERVAADFFSWRAQTAPFSSDDVPRMERPLGSVHDWTAAGVERQRKQLAVFDARWNKLGNPDAPISQQVDHRLLGSALARVHWELDVLKRWQRDPNFYIEQTLAPVGEALAVPGPYDEKRSREILARLDAIPGILAQAEETLNSPPAPFAKLAIEALDGVRPKLEEMAKTLPPETTIPALEWKASSERAAAALEEYRAWLERALPGLAQDVSIGRENYVWFLRNVALIPYTPEELARQAEQEWRRAVAFEAYEENRNREVPPLVTAATTAEFVARNEKDESQVRKFVEERGILTLPSWLHHYTLRALPAYLAPFADFVETDDFTSATRLDQDGIRYVSKPSLSAGYFWVSDAMDPRVSIVHEGTVGHYGQLCMSWRNPDPIRRHYFDSEANGGIGFYAEEMMLQAGLYDDSPHTREIVYNQMLLRALRVIVDVKVALGEFTQDQAADFLEKNVPMTAASAHQEVVEMNEAPGAKISYQTGKLQILGMLAEARRKQGAAFSLRAFHDYVWLNGNVPIALLRWEYLGKDNEVKKLESARRAGD
jgi:hypothetical protein